MSSYASATTDFPVHGLPSTATVNVPTTTIQRHLDAASSGPIDGALSARGALPVAGPPYPEPLIAIACHIASYTLMRSIGFNPESPNDQAIVDAYEQATTTLDGWRAFAAIPWTPTQPLAPVASDSPRGWYEPDGIVVNDDGSGTIR